MAVTKLRDVTVQDCMKVLRVPIEIATGYASDGRLKRLDFNPHENAYGVWHSEVYITGGNAVEEILDVYNSL
jgi:hypothetical protein